jgi:hypothetical protein
MHEPTSPNHDGSLNSVWRDVFGQPADSSPARAAIDPGTVETIRQLHALGAAAPPASSRERVRQAVRASIRSVDRNERTDLMNQALTMPITVERSTPALPMPSPWSRRPLRRDRWLWSALSVAAVIAIILGGVWRYSGTNNGGKGNGLPALAGSPIPAATTCRGTAGAAASAGTPVSLDLQVATPAATNPTVSFDWSANGPPATLGSYPGTGFMAIDPQCRLWVMDVTTNQFLIFDLDGRQLDAWGTAGHGDGQFSFGGNSYFGGIAFAKDGGFYVADPGNLRIEQFDANRRFVRQWSVVGAQAGQIAVGPDGNVYVATDGGPDPIWVYAPNGALLRKFGGQDGGPLAFDPSGNLWALEPNDASSQTLVKFSSAGTVVNRIDLSKWVGAYAFGLAIDASGRIFIADGNQSKVWVFGPTGSFLYSWGATGTQPGQFAYHTLMWIAVDGAGGVYTDGLDSRIQKFQVRP